MGVLQYIKNAQLIPAKFYSVWAYPMTLDGRSAKPSLYRRDFLNGEDPAQPTATIFCSAMHSLAEGSLLCGGVVERAHYFDVRTAGKGQDEVAGTETWVATTIDERGTQIRTDALNDVGNFISATGIRDVVQPHVGILPNGIFRRYSTPRPSRYDILTHYEPA